MTTLKDCPKCGIAEGVTEHKSHFSCRDCGSAWAKPKLKATSKPKPEKTK